MISYIFHNSLQNSEVSNKRSNTVAEQIQDVVDSDKQIEEKDLRVFVRKAAHVIEYCILGISLGGLMLSIYAKYGCMYISLSLLLALLVAVTDEYIQSFTGRTSCVEDVFIDFAGAIIGFLVAITAVCVIKKLRAKKC